MDGFVFVLIAWAVIGLIGNGLKRAKKAEQNAKKPAEAPKPKPETVKKPSVWEQIEMMGMLPKDEEPEEEKPAAEPTFGSITDYVPMQTGTEGTAKPGSIAAMASEEGPFGQTSVKYGDGEEMRASGAFGRVSSRDMKSAVVMSEILNRPVAMRRSAGAFQRRRCGA